MTTSTPSADAVLTDGVIRIRPARVGDAARYVELQDDEMIDRFEWPAPITNEGATGVFERWASGWRTGGDERNFAIELAATGEVIGSCEAEHRADGHVHLMYAVFVPWRGQGHARRAAALLLAFARATFPGARAVLLIHPDNPASNGIATGLGATPTGTEMSKAGRVVERWVIEPSELP